MEQVFLSDIELFLADKIIDSIIFISGNEANHILKVMRHKTGDKIFVTDGNGKIFQTKIINTSRRELECEIVNEYSYKMDFPNLTICIPRLRNNDRFDFALEKLVEMGITNFIVFESNRTIAKGEKLERWNKIAIAAMKQSLRSFLPNIKFAKSIEEIETENGEIISFDQNANKVWGKSEFNLTKKTILIFGPEGGYSKKEESVLNKHLKYRLTENRLRSETAIITAIAKII